MRRRIITAILLSITVFSIASWPIIEYPDSVKAQDDTLLPEQFKSQIKQIMDRQGEEDWAISTVVKNITWPEYRIVSVHHDYFCVVIEDPEVYDQTSNYIDWDFGESEDHPFQACFPFSVVTAVFTPASWTAPENEPASVELTPDANQNAAVSILYRVISYRTCQEETER